MNADTMIYVAGPFSAPTNWEMAENTRNAERFGMMLLRHGVIPLIPHTALGLILHGQAPGSFFVKATLEMMRRCDDVLVIAKESFGRASTGTLGE